MAEDGQLGKVVGHLNADEQAVFTALRDAEAKRIGITEQRRGGMVLMLESVEEARRVVRDEPVR